MPQMNEKYVDLNAHMLRTTVLTLFISLILESCGNKKQQGIYRDNKIYAYD